MYYAWGDICRTTAHVRMGKDTSKGKKKKKKKKRFARPGVFMKGINDGFPSVSRNQAGPPWD